MKKILDVFQMFLSYEMSTRNSKRLSIKRQVRLSANLPGRLSDLVQWGGGQMSKTVAGGPPRPWVIKFGSCNGLAQPKSVVKAFVATEPYCVCIKQLVKYTVYNLT